jgi:hypothetical protein
MVNPIVAFTEVHYVPVTPKTSTILPLSEVHVNEVRHVPLMQVGSFGVFIDFGKVK